MLSLPENWLEQTGPIEEVTQPPQGCNFTVYLLTAARGRFIVKHGDTPAKVAELRREGEVLEALRAHVPFVGQPVSQDEAAGLFLFTYVDGVPMVRALQQSDAAGQHRLIRAFAETLRDVHSWTPDMPRPTDWLAGTVRRAANNVAAGRIADPVEHSYGLWDGADARDVLAEVRRWHQGHPQNDIVFCHGDYCLPNVLVENGAVSGLIDWSWGGYADRRFDLATALYTIRRNLGDEAFVRTFLDAYGYHEPTESLRYFEALYVLY